MATNVFYGDVKCKTPFCKNGAYWNNNGVLQCGMHTRKNKHTRILLPKRPKAEIERMKHAKKVQDMLDADEAQARNFKEGKKGQLIVTKMAYFHSPETVKGFLKVFPNYADENREDGIGCSSLSPKSMGPVNHGQPDLPPAKSLENFHQGSKCFREETDPLDDTQITPLFFENQRRFFEDPQPHRHKYHGQDKKRKNIPLFFVWKEQDGTYHRLTYVDSRQFYCNFYERFALPSKDFKYLQQKLRTGYNLQIVGFDGHPMDGRTLEEWYLDPAQPFGHELCLYTLLTVDDPKDYPWRKYKTFDF